MGSYGDLEGALGLDDVVVYFLVEKSERVYIRSPPPAPPVGSPRVPQKSGKGSLWGSGVTRL